MDKTIRYERVEVPIAPRSKSRNVNAYVNAVLTRNALKRAVRRTDAELTIAAARLTGAMVHEASRILADIKESV
jgi:hypothetical protein